MRRSLRFAVPDERGRPRKSEGVQRQNLLHVLRRQWVPAVDINPISATSPLHYLPSRFYFTFNLRPHSLSLIMSKFLALASLAALALAVPAPRQVAGKGPQYVPLPVPRTPSYFPPPEVIIQLFQWNWDSVANECRDFIGPAGGFTFNVKSRLHSFGSTVIPFPPLTRMSDPVDRIRLRSSKPCRRTHPG